MQNVTILNVIFCVCFTLIACFLNGVWHECLPPQTIFGDAWFKRLSDLRPVRTVSDRSLWPTFRGASRSLWIPAICSLSAAFSSRVTVGGLRGSGKFVQINGSESSRYWTRQTMEAMTEWPRPTAAESVWETRCWLVRHRRILSNEGIPGPPHSLAAPPLEQWSYCGYIHMYIRKHLSK